MARNAQYATFALMSMVSVPAVLAGTRLFQILTGNFQFAESMFSVL